ncbi:hypothetical protein JCM11491_005307 [Sporobolomyces phaffii]
MPRATASSSNSALATRWLIKAEPETRIEKGVDVKFSIDDLERCKISSWEGVRNHEAKKYLKDQMKLDQLCLFYASNCKVPGVSGIAKVVKEGYPDHNAWDPKHPYYDPKSKADSPTWYMVDVEFVSKLPHLVPLALLQHLSKISTPPAALAPYLTAAHLAAIAESALIKRGRLSVQPASEPFFDACRLLGERGGFADVLDEIKRGKSTAKGKGKAKAKVEEEEEVGPTEEVPERAETEGRNKRRKVDEEEEEGQNPARRKGRAGGVPAKNERRKAVKGESDNEGAADEESAEEKMPTRGSRTRSSTKR